MRSLLLPILLAAALAACETTNEDEWTGGATTPFDQAEDSCETETQSIAEEADRPAFFVACMAALGWTPRPGTLYSQPAAAPDPT